MLNTPTNEWTLKAIQLEAALLALGEADLPEGMKALQDKAEGAMRELVSAWIAKKPAADGRKWKVAADEKGGTPENEELAEVVSQLKEDEVEWRVHRATSDKGDTVEAVIVEDWAWMAAGGDFYVGQWDEEQKALHHGRDDEEGELGTGLVLTLQGELVFESQLEG